MSRVLITGANGTIARHLIATLMREGVPVRGTVRRRTHDFPANLDLVETGNLGPGTDWREALAGIACVVHLAARVHRRGASPNEARQYRATNVEATLALAEQAADKGVPRLLFVSSIGAQVAEASPSATAYQRSKLEAERGLAALASRHNLALVVLRPPAVYGPGAPGGVSRLMRAVAGGWPLPLAGIRNRRTFVYVENLADALAAIVREETFTGGPYDISDGEAVSTPDLVRLMGDALGRRPRLFACPAPLLVAVGRMTGRDREVAALTRSLEGEAPPLGDALGWTPPRTLRDGLHATASAFRHET